jgi:glycosyltransferase involved in cell wall biosynthesis
LHVYGHPTEYLKSVMQSVRERGLEKSVIWFGGKSQQSIAGAIDVCDVGIIPNQHNAFTNINTPTRVFEYLALGKPVIAPRTPGIQDYFDEESLLYFESGNADQLADQIEFVAFHPDAAASITKRGQQVYQGHFWESEKRNLIDLVEKLLRPGNRV